MKVSFSNLELRNMIIPFFWEQDVVSTHQGYGKRYGFVYVNRGEADLMDMRRIRKDSFYWYQQMIRDNG